MDGGLRSARRGALRGKDTQRQGDEVHGSGRRPGCSFGLRLRCDPAEARSRSPRSSASDRASARPHHRGKGYDARHLWEAMKARGVDLIAPHLRHLEPTLPGWPKSCRYRRRWIVERTNAWLFNFRRLVVRYEAQAGGLPGPSYTSPVPSALGRLAGFCNGFEGCGSRSALSFSRACTASRLREELPPHRGPRCACSRSRPGLRPGGRRRGRAVPRPPRHPRPRPRSRPPGEVGGGAPPSLLNPPSRPSPPSRSRATRRVEVDAIEAALVAEAGSP